jgi:glycosyltransferase involved in cell wall biosynthesis
MRILQIAPNYLPAVRHGGPIFAVHGLCRALAARGHEVQVFTTNRDGRGVTPTPIGTPVDLDGVQIRYFPCPLIRRLYWAPALGWALHHAIGKFDILHLHTVFLWPTWAAAREARNAGVPYVLSPRGMLVKDLIARRSRLAKSAWIHLIERSNVEQAAALHLTSELERTELECFGWRLPRPAVIPNAIDEPISANGNIASDVEAIASEQPLVLFLGRLSWKKGLDRLLRAFAHTQSGILAVVGTDDFENLAPKLVKLAAELRIADRVRILPRTVVGSEKERLFAAARLFVLPSYSENFGNTVLEAMRRGVPVVVTPEVGAAEIVRKSGAGLVVAGDPEPLGSAIGRLTADLNLARSMGEAGRHTAAHFSWDQIATQMEDLYNSLSLNHRTRKP